MNSLKAYYFILVYVCSSCAFNNMFLVPDTSRKAEYKLRSGGKVSFDTTTFEPTFNDSLGNAVDLGYQLENFTFNSQSGNQLNGWYLKPDTIVDVTIIHFHGNAGFLLSQIRAIDPLVKHGFQIFMFDYSGFGFSSGEATRKNVWSDAEAMIAYVKQRPEIKNTKLVVYGQSLGGHLAAAQSPYFEGIDGLVIEGAFASHSSIAGRRVPLLGNIFVREMYSAKKGLRKSDIPTLLIHSTEDQTIPFKQGQKLYENVNGPKEFYEIDQCHICGPSYYSAEIAGKIRKMLGLN